MPSPLPITIVAGARPNFMKIGPLVHAFQRAGLPYKLIHTGQHYDKGMSDVFFQELGIPAPDVSLGVGSGTQAEQTGNVMIAFERYLLENRPSWIVVVGDVNSTMACSLVGAKLQVPVAHLEAGLRSRDWSMPEEVNRVVTDRVSDLLLTPSRDGDENLLAEGVPQEKIKFVGNIMIDTLLRLLPEAERRSIGAELGVRPKEYAVGTFHRPANVDSPEQLEAMVDMWLKIVSQIPFVLPLHPRTQNALERSGHIRKLEDAAGLHVLPPLGYLDFLALNRNARFVLTDSGGVQEETTVLGIPCLTFRNNTERPVTITHGTNRLIGTDPKAALQAIDKLMAGDFEVAGPPELWDGKTGERCAAIFAELLN